MTSLMSKLLGSGSPRSKRRPALQLESLEERRVMSATVSHGALVITQTNGNDTCVVSQTTRDGRSLIFVNDNGVVSKFDRRSRNIQTIVYVGNYGNDRFTNNTQLSSTADGGYGNDVLVGGKKGDILRGGFGNDRLEGREGNDILDGGAGSDVLYGEDGDDLLFGGIGNDLLDGGEGNDTLHGGDGLDILVGDFGNDKLFGEGGYDLLYGNGGDDYLNGGTDHIADRLEGGLGKDYYVGEWVPDSGRLGIAVFGRYKNLDKPVDFNAEEGDAVSPPPLLVLTQAAHL